LKLPEHVIAACQSSPEAEAGQASIATGEPPFLLSAGKPAVKLTLPPPVCREFSMVYAKTPKVPKEAQPEPVVAGQVA
jgi:hypothetical protein